MIGHVSAPRLKGHRFPRSIISYAVWAYYRFSLSLRDVEALLAERGVVVSYGSIRAWVGQFGSQIAKRVRAVRPRLTDKWHLDEVALMINGMRHWLWRAVDSNGEVLDILVQTRRNARAAERFISRLITRWGERRVIVTDKLCSYGAALTQYDTDALQCCCPALYPKKSCLDFGSTKTRTKPPNQAGPSLLGSADRLAETLGVARCHGRKGAGSVGPG